MDTKQLIAHGVMGVAVVAVFVYANRRQAALEERIAKLEKAERGAGAGVLIDGSESIEEVQASVKTLTKSMQTVHSWAGDNFKQIKAAFDTQNVAITKANQELARQQQIVQALQQQLAEARVALQQAFSRARAPEVGPSPPAVSAGSMTLDFPVSTEHSSPIKSSAKGNPFNDLKE